MVADTIAPEFAATIGDTAPASRAVASVTKRGDALGRYVVLSRLGGGGMGVVFEAYDPELDRRVALKLLRSEQRSAADNVDASARLVREAQALAKLSHPNVVAVHDVGVVGDHVFVAMEFVAGQTLAAWMSQPERSWHEVVKTFARAGKGLAAAHEAGILHRDFKPDNVVVGDDGRVRVIDFGLARSEAGADAHLGAGAELAKHTVHTRLTRTGALLGTPAYMAPEQFHAEPVDPRTDQFSFCVALYEGLYGERPFAGDTLGLLSAAVSAGEINEAPRGSRVPAWLRRVVVRGLAANPAERFGSMTELLDALARDPRRVAKRVVPALALGVIAFALWHGREAHSAPPVEVCKGADRKLANIWPARADQIRVAFAGTHLPYADDAFRGVSQAFDDYARDWAAMHTEACEATSIRHEQSEQLLDLRMSCLQRRAAELDAQSEIFTHADASVVAKATAAATSLSTLRDCADIELLKAPIPPPPDRERRSQIDALRMTLSRVRAMTAAGQYVAALPIAADAARASAEIHYAPVQAEALFLRGQLENLTGALKPAETSLHDSELLAITAHDEHLLADVWSSLIEVVGTNGSRFADADPFARYAAALSERLTGRPRAAIANARGSMLRAQAKYDEALAQHRAALAIYEAIGAPAEIDAAATLYNIANTLFLQGKYADADAAHLASLQIRERALGADHPDVARSLNNIGNGLRMEGKYDEALAHHRRALEIRQRSLGEEHSDVAVSLNNLGAVLEALNRPADAAADYRRAAAIFAKALGPDAPKVAAVLDNLGNAERTMGRYSDSLEHHRQGLAIREKTLGAEHPEVATSLNNLGETLNSMGRYAEALVAYRRALAITTKKLGPQHSNVAVLVGNIGSVLIEQRKYREALVEYQRAAALVESTLGKAHPSLGFALTGVGKATLALGDASHAIEPLERALVVRASVPGDSYDRAVTKFALARALSASGGSRERAMGLASDARRECAAVQTAAARRQVAAIDVWLGARS